MSQRKITTIPIINTIILMLGFLFVVSCGGGGSNGSQVTPTPKPTIPIPIPAGSTFSLNTVFSPSPAGQVYTTQLKGGDLLGNTLTGSLTRSNLAQILLGGIMVTPSEVVIMIMSNLANQTDIFTEYYDASGNFISSKESDGTVCTPVVVQMPPLLVKVGDTGTIPNLSCSDGRTLFSTWQVNDAGDGTVFFIISGGEKDMNGVQVVSYVNTFKINSAGALVSLKFVTKDTAGINTTTIESI